MRRARHVGEWLVRDRSSRRGPLRNSLNPRWALIRSHPVKDFMIGHTLSLTVIARPLDEALPNDGP